MLTLRHRISWVHVAILLTAIILCLLALAFVVLFFWTDGDPPRFDLNATAKSAYATNTAVEKFIEGTQTMRAATAPANR